MDEQLYDVHSESVYRLAFYVLKEVKYAGEIVQDTFMQVWDKRIEPDFEGNIATYLHVICHNKSFNKSTDMILRSVPKGGRLQLCR